jgi:hypothetical protein
VIANVLSARRLAAAGAVVLAAGAAVAQAAGSGAPATPKAPRAAAPAPAPVRGAPPALVVAPRCRPPRDRNAPRTPPSEALKNAFGILRRERDENDALPARALKALEAQGLEPVDAESARLLRADGDARAWIVPVPDVASATPLRCVRGTTVRKPREGVAVVSVNGAPAGGGGALRDLQRGLAPAAVQPCAGAGGNMVGISGVVPDGVEAVFVTAADGTSTRADVHANGYSFVLPATRRFEQRYIVWTGADGGPHVQPLPPFVPNRPSICDQVAKLTRVTPDPFSAACAALPAFAGPAPIVTAPRRGARARPPLRPVPALPAMGACVLSPRAALEPPPRALVPGRPPRLRMARPGPALAPPPRAAVPAPAPSRPAVPPRPQPQPQPAAPAGP